MSVLEVVVLSAVAFAVLAFTHYIAFLIGRATKAIEHADDERDRAIDKMQRPRG